MDIDFEKDNNRFLARVSAIILNKDKTKILLFKVEDGRDYFLLPGGRVEYNEDSLSAIKREINQELGFTIDFNLCAIQEIFTERNNQNISQYCFCYKGIYEGIIESDKIECLDNEGQSFYWVDIDKLSDYKVYPESTIKLINSENLEHIIERV